MTKKPIILSTGAANIKEIKFAVNYLKNMEQKNNSSTLYIKLSSKR